jgi:Fe-S cluster biogenesis protein NfuA
VHPCPGRHGRHAPSVERIVRLLGFKPRPDLLDRGVFYDDVRAVIEEVRVYAHSHGGDIRLVGVTVLGDVTISFEGACRGCPLTEITLRVHVERALRDRVPGVRKVRQR